MAKGKPQRKREHNPKLNKTPLKRQNPVNYDDMPFTWRVHNNYIDYDHRQFGWRKVEITQFLKNIVQLLQSYEGLKWHEVKRKPHCHFWSLDEIPRECYNRLEERQMDVEQLFQIGLGNKPRIIGYKIGSILYLVWYDPDHKFWPTKAK